MKILVLNGSPRENGNIAAMVKSYVEGATEAGNDVTVFEVCKKNIAGCLGCEYCHQKGNGECVQKDDVQELYGLLKEAEMLVIASPIYFFGFSAQLQAAINRTYAVGIPEKLNKAALILSSGSKDVYDGAIYEYKKLCEWMKLTDMGVITAHREEHGSPEKLSEAHALGKNSL